MAISHSIGLYTPFKLIRPLTSEEREHMYCQGQPLNHGGEAVALSFDTVVRMNSTYLEVVDKFYSDKGIICSMMMCMLSLLLCGIIFMVWSVLLSPDHTKIFFGVFFCTLTALPAYFFFWKVLKKDLFKNTYYPVRFNRKKQIVHVYQLNNEVISVPWADIYFTTSKQKMSYCIVGHILADDKDTVLNTFSFGYIGFKEALDCYWEFIRCYMEENCLEELAETIKLCPPIENRREGYVFGLQRLLKMDSRLEWPFLPISVPESLVESVGRYIAMQTCKIPQWPQEVLDACKAESDDPVNISAANNPEHLWRHIFANDSREFFDKKNNQIEMANNKIRAKLNARYGEQQ